MEDRQCIQLLTLLRDYWQEYGSKDYEGDPDNCTVMILATDITQSLEAGHEPTGLEVLGVTS